jgi:hypothetical protein
MAKEYGTYVLQGDDEDLDVEIPPDSDSDDEAPPLLQPGDLDQLRVDFLDDLEIT